MSFKKLIEPLKDNLKKQGFETPLPLQQQSLSLIKGGNNIFGIGPDGSGKTTTLIISVIQKLKGVAVDDAPRAMIFVKDKQAALDLQVEFQRFTKGTDLRIYCAYDEYNLELQREEIYLGTDIIIGTPKRINKLFFLNSIHLTELLLFCIDNADFIFRNNIFTDITRITESIDKCQYLIFANTFDARFERFQESFMFNSQVITVD